MSSKSYYEIAAPAQCPLERNELYMHLYLRQAAEGPNRNQDVIVSPQNAVNGFGVTAVNDWTIADGLGPNATIVARAEGLHMNASIRTNRVWYTAFNIVFEDDRFKGSTLQVMGVFNDAQWGISSGTGELALAHGIIKQKEVQASPGESIKELHIHAFYTPMNNSVVPGALDGKSWTLGA